MTTPRKPNRAQFLAHQKACEPIGRRKSPPRPMTPAEAVIRKARHLVEDREMAKELGLEE